MDQGSFYCHLRYRDKEGTELQCTQGRTSPCKSQNPLAAGTLLKWDFVTAAREENNDKPQKQLSPPQNLEYTAYMSPEEARRPAAVTLQLRVFAAENKQQHQHRGITNTRWWLRYVPEGQVNTTRIPVRIQSWQPFSVKCSGSPRRAEGLQLLPWHGADLLSPHICGAEAWTPHMGMWFPSCWEAEIRLLLSLQGPESSRINTGLQHPASPSCRCT